MKTDTGFEIFYPIYVCATCYGSGYNIVGKNPKVKCFRCKGYGVFTAEEYFMEEYECKFNESDI